MVSVTVHRGRVSTLEAGPETGPVSIVGLTAAPAVPRALTPGSLEIQSPVLSVAE